MKSGGYLQLLGGVLVLALACYLGAWGFAQLSGRLSTARVDELTLADGSRVLMLPREALLEDDEGGYYVLSLVAGQEQERAITVLEFRGDFVIAALEEPFDALRPGNTVILDAPTGE